MRRAALAWCLAAGIGAVAAALLGQWPRPGGACGDGSHDEAGRCAPSTPCPPLLQDAAPGRAGSARVLVAQTTVSIGPSDWEAEGRVAPRVVDVRAFLIDAFEATAGDVAATAGGRSLRPATALSRDEAAAYCARQGGRLPTEDEWIAAAAGTAGHRYPWGETGAVCRRAAFGLARGPCATDRGGPDPIGAHADGDTPTGIHDLGGNVAEWVSAPPGSPHRGVAKGGSWRSELASDLRVWARLELDPESHDDRVGVRCAYDAP
jgi:formylglycine-generating enzyme required for sulfatase activity